jgi:hypothetical protein
MEIMSRIRVALVAGTLPLSLAACGGGEVAPAGAGGGDAGTSTATISTGGGGAGLGTGAGGGGGEAWDGNAINDTANGTPESWPLGRTLQNLEFGMSFIGSFSPNVDLWVVVPDARQPGTFSCEADYGTLLWTWPPQGGDYKTTYAGGSCTITLSHVPEGVGDYWGGTFSGTAPSAWGDPPIVYTDGEFHILKDK